MASFQIKQDSFLPESMKKTVLFMYQKSSAVIALNANCMQRLCLCGNLSIFIPKTGAAFIAVIPGG